MTEASRAFNPGAHWGEHALSQGVSTIEPSGWGLKRDALPVREFRKQRLRHAWRGFSSSHKIRSSRMRICETTLERDAHTLLSADPQVLYFGVQPHWLTFWHHDDQGRAVRQRYAPDIIAQLRNGRRVVIEIKSTRFATVEPWLSREPAIRAAYAQHDIDFVVQTELEIRNQPRLENCRIMLSHRSFGVDARHLIAVRDSVGALSSPATIATILDAAQMRGGEKSPSFSALMQMILTGEIAVDLSRPLADGTLVRWQ